MTVALNGRIDSANAAQTENDITAQLAGQEGSPLTVDASGLEYISSAGLRVLLRLRKGHPEMRITGVSPGIYEILEMTGFTEMMPVERAYSVVSIDGCEEIGRGANGAIYRIDQDNVVKVYLNPGALEDILHEREVAKLALILGIPTAISYDVVRVGDSYGSVFELLNAVSFSKILATQPEKMDWCVEEYAALLKKIHGTVVPEGKLPDMKEKVLSWARFLRDYLPEEAGKKLEALVEAVPRSDRMIHGDYHTKNVMLMGSEVLLIDMDTLAVGDPVFELAGMFNAFIGFSELDRQVILDFQGFDHETAETFWRKALAAYLGTDSEEKLRAAQDKASVVGYVDMIQWFIRRGSTRTEADKKQVAFWTQRLLSALERTDSLTLNGADQ